MSASDFKDHFSGHAAGYRDARPGYPAALYQWLATLPAAHQRAWDAGCGNGQATVALAAHFDMVVGSDPSAPQIAVAEPHPRVRYVVEAAEATTIDAASIDLVTVAQALHWFDQPRFYAEARRVAKPGAVLAAWTYALCSVTPAVDAVVEHFYTETVGRYWPPERRDTENGYASLPFPFAAIAAPPFAMQEHWTLAQFCAYLRSWSASQRYVKAEHRDPVAALEPALMQAWGAAGQRQAVRWPLALRVGRIG